MSDRTRDASSGEPEGSFPEKGLWRAPTVVMIALAFALGIRTTNDLDWPFGVDAFRDVAQAQTLVDTGQLADPYYLRERAWYSPLGPLIVAATSVAAGLDVPRANARLGPYVNLVTPLGVVLLASSWFGTRVAAISIVFLLFGARGPDYLEPTYSPWLFGHNFAPGLFLLTLLAYAGLERLRGLRFWACAALTGTSLGLTFLAHAAPAIVFAVVAGTRALGTVLGRWRLGDRVARPLGSLALIAAVALLVAAPFLWPIAERYQFVVINPRPNVWLDPSLAADSLVTLLVTILQPWWRLLLAVVGVGFVVRGPRVPAKPLALAWVGAAFLLFFYSRLGADLAQSGPLLPLLVPAHHFLLSFRLAMMLLAAVGLVGLLDFLVGRLGLGRLGRTQPGLRLLRNAALSAFVLGFLAMHWTPWVQHDMFTTQRAAARSTYPGEWETLRRWVRSHTTPSDVFLATNDVALSLVGVWGRKVVSVAGFFSNPFVDLARRDRARADMEESLVREDCSTFRALAAHFNVTHVAVVEGRSPPIAPGACGLVAGATAPATVVYCAHPSRPSVDLPSKGPPLTSTHERLRVVRGLQRDHLVGRPLATVLP